jgi:hypothetical protein
MLALRTHDRTGWTVLFARSLHVRLPAAGKGVHVIIQNGRPDYRVKDAKLHREA